MRAIFPVLVLLATSFAADAPKDEKLPEVPADYATKIQALVIQQKNLNEEMHAIQDRYSADAAALQKVNADGKKLEVELLKSLKLDPAKYSSETDSTGKVIITKNPEPKK